MFRAMWFRNSDERNWFAIQYSLYYASSRKSVVLYALRRLSLIFKMPLIKMNGNRKLVSIYDDTKSLSGSRKNYLSFLVPQGLHRNPLQLIVDDYSCAEDDCSGFCGDLTNCSENSMSLREESTVAEYVRFVVEYDEELTRTDHLRVTTSLGASPP